MFRTFLSTRTRLAVIGLLFASATQAAAAEVKLTIGSEAPEIDVEHWVQNGNGKFKPVTKFANDKVYVVEFWATWCGPCIASMPHLAELQKKYADKAQIISISDEDLETVETFLQGKVRGGQEENEEQAGDEKDGDKKDSDKEDSDKKDGDKKAEPQTYKMLTSAYCLTTDPDRSAYTDYMEAAGQNGIPTAFIVGKDGKIEWIGHPMTMDEPLEQIVAGNWDREKFAEEFKDQQRLELVMGEVGAAMRKGNTKAALELTEKALADSPAETVKERLELVRLQIQLNDKDSEEKLPEILAKAYERYAENTGLINQIAWVVSQKMEAGQLSSKEVLSATRKAVEKASKQGEGDSRAAILDTAAHIQYLDGDVDAALQTQTEAIANASPQLKEQLKEFLETLKKEKEDKASDKKKSDEKKSGKDEKKSDKK